jgi:hypothetical protein
MRKVILSVALAVMLVGFVAVPSADAQWRRRGYYYSYPAYYYPSYNYSYYPADAGAYYAPSYNYGPAYYGGYYGGGYYGRGWRGRR